MKKLFMILAAAVLAIGMVGCSNTSGDGPDKPDGEEATLMAVSITLPAGSGTRTNPTVDGKSDENAVKSLDIFVFDGNGNRPADANLHHKRWDSGSTPTFNTAFNLASNTYAGTVSFPTISGAVKVYVGLNLPLSFGSTPFATDIALKAKSETLNALSGNGNVGTNGLAMFSDMVTGTLQTVPSNTPVSGLPTENKLALKAYRTVAKVTASSAAASDPNFSVSWTPVDGVTPTLRYAVKHWFLFQGATGTFVAPNYNIDQHVSGNLPAPTQAPVTYAPGILTPAGVSGNLPAAPFYNKYAYLSSYMDDGRVTAKLNLNTGTSSTSVGTNATTIAEGANAGSVNARYMGENVGISGTGWGSNTFAFISTGVTVNAAVNWDAANKAIKWEPITNLYGFEMGSQGGEDIYYIRYNNRNYLTNTSTKVSDIRAGVAQHDHQVIIQPNVGACDPLRNDGFTDMIAADFDRVYGFETFVYQKGYAHFPFFIGQGTTSNARAYDVLRNQFIHLHVTGMTASSIDVFTGYPGQTLLRYYPGAATSQDGTNSPIQGDPSVPIDIAQPDNNPAPHDPTDPIIQVQTALAVDVDIKPWTYKMVGSTIGR